MVRGLTYTDPEQVINRELIPTYGWMYRWTGNRADAEDLTAWIFESGCRRLGLPDLVEVVDERFASLGAAAIARHWWERYAVAALSGHAAASNRDARPPLESLLARLTAEEHHILMLRFVRRQSTAAIAGQLGLPVATTAQRMLDGLTKVTAQIGFQPCPEGAAAVEDVSDFIDDLVARRRPVRFDVNPEAWPVLIAACHVQAAIAGNDLPGQRFVRALDRRLRGQHAGGL